MDPIALLHSRYDTLTNAEQKLADYIISNPRCMLEGRMSQLSKNAGSSNAALARLCQKLGYDGFTQLGYYRMGRNCYTKEDVEKFRAAVVKYVVPVAEEIYRKRAVRHEIGRAHV